MPEQNVGKLRVGQTIELTVDAFPGKVFTGTVASLDARVSQETRTLLVRGTLANPDRTLLPGMFANVAVLAGAPAKVVTVPRTAVTYSLYGDSVYVLKNARGPAGARQAGGHRLRRRAPLREERTGARRPRGHHSGLKEGEQVVTTGQVKLTTAASVKVDNSQALVPPAVRPYQ